MGCWFSRCEQLHPTPQMESSPPTAEKQPKGPPFLGTKGYATSFFLCKDKLEQSLGAIRTWGDMLATCCLLARCNGFRRGTWFIPKLRRKVLTRLSRSSGPNFRRHHWRQITSNLVHSLQLVNFMVCFWEASDDYAGNPGDSWLGSRHVLSKGIFVAAAHYIRK